MQRITDKNGFHTVRGKAVGAVHQHKAALTEGLLRLEQNDGIGWLGVGCGFRILGGGFLLPAAAPEQQGQRQKEKPEKTFHKNLPLC